MKLWYNVINFLGLLCILFIISNLCKQNDIYDKEYNAKRLALSVEYATEVAFFDSIGQDSNDNSYLDAVNVSINPEKTLESFNTMMELNYGLSRSSASAMAVEDSIGTAVLACADGFYITKMAETADGEYALHWTPKLSYNTEIGTSTYGVCLSSEQWFKATLNEDTHSYQLKSGSKYSDYEVAGIITKKEAKRIVSSTLTDAITQSLDDNTFLSGENGYGLYIPSSQTISGINDIDSPSLLVIIRDADYAGFSGTQNAAITGLKVIKKTKVVAYKDNKGCKLYSYESQGASEKYDVIQYYNSVEDAAAAGYLADYNFIFHKIHYNINVYHDSPRN